MKRAPKTILIVDDIASIRFSIREYLQRDFNTLEANSAQEAISICRRRPVDLLLTDIRMPGMDGIELIHQLKREFANMQFALMTAYNADEYIRFAREDKIWNIIPKSALLDIGHIGILAHKLLLSDNIFGIHYYFPQADLKKISISDLEKRGARGQRFFSPLLLNHYYTCSIHTLQESLSANDIICELLIAGGALSAVRTVLEELTSNVMKHTGAIRQTSAAEPGDTTGPSDTTGPGGKERELPAALGEPPRAEAGEVGRGIEIEPFELSFGLFEDYTAISLMDHKGSFDSDTMLSRLERQVTIDKMTGLPIGISDLNARGLYISRHYCEHLIFNVEPQKHTEIIAILPHTTFQNSQAISIYQQRGGP